MAQFPPAAAGGRSAALPRGGPGGRWGAARAGGGGGAPPHAAHARPAVTPPWLPALTQCFNCCISESPRAGRGRGAVRQGVGVPSRSFLRVRRMGGWCLG